MKQMYSSERDLLRNMAADLIEKKEEADEASSRLGGTAGEIRRRYTTDRERSVADLWRDIHEDSEEYKRQRESHEIEALPVNSALKSCSMTARTTEFSGRVQEFTALQEKSNILRKFIAYVNSKLVNSYLSALQVAEILEEVEAMKILPLSSQPQPSTSSSLRDRNQKDRKSDSGTSKAAQDFLSLLSSPANDAETKNYTGDDKKYLSGAKSQNFGLQKLIQSELEAISKTEGRLGLISDFNVLSKITKMISRKTVIGKSLTDPSKENSQKKQKRQIHNLRDLEVIASFALQGKVISSGILSHPMQVEEVPLKMLSPRNDGSRNFDERLSESTHIESEDVHSARKLGVVRLALAKMEYLLKLLTSAKDVEFRTEKSGTHLYEERDKLVDEIHRNVKSSHHLARAKKKAQEQLKYLVAEREKLRARYLQLFPEAWAAIPKDHKILAVPL